MEGPFEGKVIRHKRGSRKVVITFWSHLMTRARSLTTFITCFVSYDRERGKKYDSQQKERHWVSAKDRWSPVDAFNWLSCETYYVFKAPNRCYLAYRGKKMRVFFQWHCICNLPIYYDCWRDVGYSASISFSFLIDSDSESGLDVHKACKAS